VKRSGETLSLTPLGVRLWSRSRASRQVFTGEVLLEAGGLRHGGRNTRMVNVTCSEMRAKIEKDRRPEIVVTVRGVGYKAGPGRSAYGARLR